MFRQRPYLEPRKSRSAAQRAATDRNFRIFKLRGLWTFAYLLTGERREKMQRLVDAELKAIGADTQAEHVAKIHARWEALDNHETEIPF